MFFTVAKYFSVSPRELSRYPLPLYNDMIKYIGIEVEKAQVEEWRNKQRAKWGKR